MLLKGHSEFTSGIFLLAHLLSSAIAHEFSEKYFNILYSVQEEI